VVALDDLLTSSNQVRDEFRKRLPFPLVLWVNDEVLQKLVRFAPDFASWAATPIKFEIATSELIDFLRQKADSLFNTVLSGGSGRYAPWRVCMHHSSLNLAAGCRSRLELDSALRDLQSRQQVIKPELEASLQFVFGQYDYASDLIDSAISSLPKKLEVLASQQQSRATGSPACFIWACVIAAMLTCIGLNDAATGRKHGLIFCNVLMSLHRQGVKTWWLSLSLNLLRYCNAWKLGTACRFWAESLWTLHQTYGSKVQLAQDYGFLAEVALGSQGGQMPASKLNKPSQFWQRFPASLVSIRAYIDFYWLSYINYFW
jgi:hypothetical protein